jgi:hypothetical protein
MTAERRATGWSWMSSSSLPIPRQRAEGVDPAGSVLIERHGDHLLVKLSGTIDRTVAASLDAIVQDSRAVGRLTIDGSQVTFCDATLQEFIARMMSVMPVTIRRPSRVFQRSLDLSELSAIVIIEGPEGDPP